MSTAVFTTQEHTLPSSHIREYPRATIDGQDEALHLAIKQYTPRERFTSRQEVTVIGAHANGFPKVQSRSLFFFAAAAPLTLSVMPGTLRTSLG